MNHNLPTLRWNFKADNHALYVCREAHDNGEPCEFQVVSPHEALEIINDLRATIINTPGSHTNAIKGTATAGFAQDKLDLLEAKARELIKWLNEYGHPHMSIEVHVTGYTLNEGIVGSGQITDYVRD